MTIKSCDNCKHIIEDGDLEKLRMYSGFDNDFEICGKCKTKLIDLIAKSEMFEDDFKERVMAVDPLVEKMKTLKKS